MTSTTTVELLLASVGAEKHDELLAMPELAAVLDRQLAAIVAAWPTLAPEPELYVRRLAAAITARASEPASRVVQTVPAVDLYLAAACTAGDAAALARFRDEFLPELRHAVERLRAPAATVDEVEQRVMVMLFVGDAPQIAGYSGRGRLRNWVRSIAVRTGRRLLGLHAAGDAEPDELAELPAAVRSPELDVLRARYVTEVRGALAAALAGLTERQRTLLRQSYFDDLTIDELGRLYRVNRATAARWIAAARTELLAALHHRLVADYGVPASEVDGVIDLVRSQLSVSIRALG